jgi:hypothetical protein
MPHVEDDSERTPGQRKGLSVEEYRNAVMDRGSIRGASLELGVDRKTVRDQCIRHEIEVPSLGGVPEPLPSQEQ